MGGRKVRADKMTLKIGLPAKERDLSSFPVSTHGGWMGRLGRRGMRLLCRVVGLWATSHDGEGKAGRECVKRRRGTQHRVEGRERMKTVRNRKGWKCDILEEQATESFGLLVYTEAV